MKKGKSRLKPTFLIVRHTNIVSSKIQELEAEDVNLVVEGA